VLNSPLLVRSKKRSSAGSALSRRLCFLGVRWTFTATPKKLYIEPRPGGGFYEIFNDAGEGALGATVTYAERAKRLRFTGPLVLSGKVADFAVTYDLAPDPDGTRFHLTVNIAGQLPDGVEKIVDSVWHHMLVEQLKPYLESQEYKQRKGPR